MSAYLMTQKNTSILAVYAENIGLAKSARIAATMLRSANNAALKARYNDKLVKLTKLIDQDILLARADFKTRITIGGKFDSELTRLYILRIAETFHYQCSEGNCEIVPGYKLIAAIVASLKK